ncbi:MAG: prepilin-type N-terminal cleavage/methylation domain-containing protein [Gemmatimonas sp.]
MQDSVRWSAKAQLQNGRLPRRGGFTLMEIMIALTVTALVATLAAAALHAGLDVRERVQQHRFTLDAEARATTWLGVMLRHPPVASAVNEAMFSISQNADGNASTTFLSQGVETPAGTGTIWRVTLSVFSDGLHIRAVPTNTTHARVPLETVLPHVTQLDVEALEASGIGAASWRSDWPVLRSMPGAVRITMGDRMPVVYPVSPLTVVAR